MKSRLSVFLEIENILTLTMRLDRSHDLFNIGIDGYEDQNQLDRLFKKWINDRNERADEDLRTLCHMNKIKIFNLPSMPMIYFASRIHKQATAFLNVLASYAGRIYIVSSGKRPHRLEIIKAHCLWPYIDGIFCKEELDVGKPVDLGLSDYILIDNKQADNISLIDKWKLLGLTSKDLSNDEFMQTVYHWNYLYISSFEQDGREIGDSFRRSYKKISEHGANIL